MKIIKVIFWIAVITALWALAMSIIQGIGNCLERSLWVGWVLSIAFWVGVIWYNTKKER